jgi:hypothetical protein
MRAAGPIQEYITAAHPLIVLLQELLEHTESQEIVVHKPGLKVVLKQGSAVQGGN